MTAGINLFEGFFQLGYVTRSLEDAMTLCRDRFGIGDYHVIDASLVNPRSGNRVASAWVGDVMIELIEPRGETAPIYADYLPAGDDAIRLHHHAYATRDVARYAALADEVHRQKLAMPLINKGSNLIDYFYADTRATIGHYLEFVLILPNAEALLDKVPRF